MAKLRLLHLADTHLGIEKYGRTDPATGLNTRLLDFTACLDEAVEYAIADDLDLVVFCGDAYRSRDPSPTYQREFARRIHRLARAGIQVFLLVGNHDLPPSSSRANSVEIFETLAVENVTIGRRPGLHRLETKSGPVQIVAMPWLVRNTVLSRDEYKNKKIEEINEVLADYVATRIQEIAAELEPGVPSILAAHLSVMGAVYSSEKSVMLGQDIIVPKSVVASDDFDYVALGHIHKHQVVSNDPLAIYAGSLERIDFGEQNEDKGFVVVEIENGEAEYRFQPVQARRFVTVEVKAEREDPTEQVLAAIRKAEPDGAIVRIIIQTSVDKEAKINEAEIRQGLKDAYCVASISKQIERKTRKTFAGRFVEEMTPAQALEYYLKAKEYVPERGQLLLEYANRIISGGVDSANRANDGGEST